MSALVLAQPPQDYAESSHEKALLASGPMLFPNCPHVAEPPPAKAPLDNAPKNINANPAATLFIFIVAFQYNPFVLERYSKRGLSVFTIRARHV